MIEGDFITIKRKLFWSNVLMVIIPIIICSLLAFIIRLIIIENLEINSQKSNNIDSDRFYIIKNELESQFKFSKLDFDSLCVNANVINNKYGNDNISVAILDPINFTAIYGTFPNIPLELSNINKNIDHVFIIDQVAIYLQPIGNYILALIDTDYYQLDLNKYRDSLIIIIFIGLTIMLLIIILTNGILTRYMWKQIANSLDILCFGVHQIRDEHLGYRIEYYKNDEFLPVCNDFNEMAKRLENMILARYEDMESRKELIAGISHDLRTPLTSIKAYIEGIEKGVASTPILKQKYINIIKNKTNDLEHIVEKLFLFSKIDIDEFKLNLKSTNITKTIRSIVEKQFSEYNSKGLTLYFENSSKDLYVKADSIWIHNILINIFENSFQYKTKTKGYLKISVAKNNDKAVITLTDNGPGVSNEALPRLFDVFYRADTSRGSKGSGLGLAISAKVIKKMGGSIIAENVKDYGLSIKIILEPIVEMEA